jgi:hypothetical protein
MKSRLLRFDRVDFKRVPKLRKATIIFIISVRLSARKKLGSHSTDFRETWHFTVFQKSVEKTQVSLKYKESITGTLHEDLCTFMMVDHRIFLRIRNTSDKSYRQNQNTHFIFKKFSPKIVSFTRKNMVEPDRPQMAI